MRTVDPAFYLNADPDPDPGSQSNADPGHIIKSQIVEILHENMLEIPAPGTRGTVGTLIL
jgi:hypothetical protein